MTEREDIQSGAETEVENIAELKRLLPALLNDPKISEHGRLMCGRIDRLIKKCVTLGSMNEYAQESIEERIAAELKQFFLKKDLDGEQGELLPGLVEIIEQPNGIAGAKRRHREIVEHSLDSTRPDADVQRLDQEAKLIRRAAELVEEREELHSPAHRLVEGREKLHSPAHRLEEAYSTLRNLEAAVQKRGGREKLTPELQERYDKEKTKIEGYIKEEWDTIAKMTNEEKNKITLKRETLWGELERGFVDRDSNHTLAQMEESGRTRRMSGRQFVNSLAGALGGWGGSAGATAIAAAGFTTISTLTGGTAGLLVAGALAGAGLGRLMTRSGRARSEAEGRFKDIIGDDKKRERLSSVLINNASKGQERIQRVRAEIIDKEFGGDAYRFLRGVGGIIKDATIGVVVVQAIGAGVAVAKALYAGSAWNTNLPATSSGVTSVATELFKGGIDAAFEAGSFIIAKGAEGLTKLKSAF